jgi:hypothetical protein
MMNSVRPLFVATIAALAGCVANTGEPEEASGESSNAVVGASTTFERPEIGAVRHGNLCTGTLIRPNVVITAMHCTGIARDQDVATAQPAFTFEIRRSATEVYRYAVDRLTTLTVASDLDGSNDWRSRDIALLRLTTDVPASVARPASVATAWPRIGDRVAMYGYGCTDRAPDGSGRQPGTGTKRSRAYNWSLGQAIGWSSTQASCPGDSGGPLLDVARNGVLGITSGYVGDDDVFGDVPANNVAITTIAAQWWPRRR